jgi:diacylglycerol kinase (ATP)
VAWKNRSFPARLRYAVNGIAHALSAERSLQFQAGALLAALVGLAVLRPRPVWWALVLLAGALVLAAELMNTALEELADHLNPEEHPRIRLVKDCAAGAVLVTVLGALGVALALLVELLRP